MPLTELFARTMDNLLALANRGKQCRKQLDPDLFDGRAYSIEEFYQEHKPYFDQPAEFFRDFASPDGFHLREVGNGNLPNRLRGVAKLCHFESPIHTEYPENNLV